MSSRIRKSFLPLASATTPLNPRTQFDRSHDLQFLSQPQVESEQLNAGLAGDTTSRMSNEHLGRLLSEQGDNLTLEIVEDDNDNHLEDSNKDPDSSNEATDESKPEITVIKGRKYVDGIPYNRWRAQKAKDSGKYHCDVCSRDFVSKYTLNVHLRFSHTKEKPFSCDVCGKGFAIKNRVKEHKQVVHEQSKCVECKVCDKSFGYRSNYRKHLATEGHKRRAKVYYKLMREGGSHNEAKEVADAMDGQVDGEEVFLSTYILNPFPFSEEKPNGQRKNKRNRKVETELRKENMALKAEVKRLRALLAAEGQAMDIDTGSGSKRPNDRAKDDCDRADGGISSIIYIQNPTCPSSGSMTIDVDTLNKLLVASGATFTHDDDAESN